MKVVIAIKPKKETARTKSEVLDKVRSHKGPLLREDDSKVVLYTLEKHHKKVKINKRKKKLETSQGSTYQRDVVSPKKWVAHVYVIPKVLVKKFEQKNRTFTVELKS